MSYCVNCGVELDATASRCPLCGTKVVNPTQDVDRVSPPPFPTHRSEVPLASRQELVVLLSVMLLSAAVCCGLLNLFFRPDRPWCLYMIGAAVMLWVWIIPPLLLRGRWLYLYLILDTLALGLYLFLIAAELGGLWWYRGLALPIVLWVGACVLFLGLTLRRRSILTRSTLLIGTLGTFLFGLEFLIDRFLRGGWEPGWSLVVLAVCIALVIPLIVVRRVPGLREEARRRFHL